MAEDVPAGDAARLEAIGARLAGGNGDRCEASASCKQRFAVLPNRKLNAWADGRNVSVTSAMMRFADEDDALAFVIAHEMAHNILDHAERLKGIPSRFVDAGQAALVKRTEIDADRLAIELVAAAGFDPAASERLLHKMDKQGAVGKSAGYPSMARRIALVRKAIGKIER